MERDLVMAREIITRRLPRTTPQITGFDLAGLDIPAKIVGGDLHDSIVLPDEYYGFLVADVFGHGIPSALLMTGFRALFRGLIQNDFNIRSVFRKANQQLVKSTLPNQFASAFYASLACRSHRITYINGGMWHPSSTARWRTLIGWRWAGQYWKFCWAASFHKDSIVLRPKNILLLYSDGIGEAENPGGEAFKAQKILRVVKKIRDQSAAVICHALQEGVGKSVGFDFCDSLTVCVLKYL